MLAFYLIHGAFALFMCTVIYGLLVKVRHRWHWASVLGLYVVAIALIVVVVSGVVQDIAWSFRPDDRDNFSAKFSVGVSEASLGVMALFSLMAGLLTALEALPESKSTGGTNHA